MHEPQTKCYAKGKEYKKFGFGSKASFLITQGTGVIVGALNFTQTLHDSKTLSEALQQYERLTGKQPQNIFFRLGLPRSQKINNTYLHTPIPDKNITTSKRRRHRRRAAIEPIIGHLKHDHVMIRNYLKGTAGDAINLMLAASAVNFKRVMNIFKMKMLFFVRNFFAQILSLINFLFPLNIKLTF